MKITNTLIFLTAFGVYAYDGNAATTISTTLTMTSPTAIISMTSPSSTAYLANIVGTTISTTNISATNVSTSTIVGPANVALAKVYFNGTGSCSIVGTPFNVASCSRATTGTYGVSFTTPLANANYIVNCIPQGPALFATLNAAISPTTTGFNINTANTGSATDSGRIMCTVF